MRVVPDLVAPGQTETNVAIYTGYSINKTCRKHIFRVSVCRVIRTIVEILENLLV